MNIKIKKNNKIIRRYKIINLLEVGLDTQITWIRLGNIKPVPKKLIKIFEKIQDNSLWKTILITFNKNCYSLDLIQNTQLTVFVRNCDKSEESDLIKIRNLFK